MSEIEKVLWNHLGQGAAEITPMSGGNISNVFSFILEGKDYVVKFSDLERAYETEQFVSICYSTKVSLSQNVWV